MNDNSLTVSQWLNQATRDLSAAGIETPRLDALVLLSDVTITNRTHLLAHPELELTHEQYNRLQNVLSRRLAHEPLAYIRQNAEFYGREFMVNDSVLVPRPESETMIDLLKLACGSYETSDYVTLIDVGTGSGALAITAALELPQTRVYALDIDENCLSVAKENARRQHIDIECVQSDLLANLPQTKLSSPLIILANLPYVPDNHSINSAAQHEPSKAIFGGTDGLSLYRILFDQLAEWNYQPLYVFTEALPFQHAALENIARTQKFTVAAQQDFIQVFKR